MEVHMIYVQTDRKLKSGRLVTTSFERFGDFKKVLYLYAFSSTEEYEKAMKLHNPTEIKLKRFFMLR
jgi:hypothetical protein